MGKTLASYRRLFDSLSKNKFYKLYLLYGGEEFMKKEFISSLIKTLLPEEKRIFNLDMFYGDDFDQNAFDDRISTFPLFADRRMVIIRMFDQLSIANKDFVLERVKRIPDSLTVVVDSSSQKIDNARLKALKGIADKEGISFQFKYLSEQETIERVKARLKKEGLDIEPDALNLLLESVGTQLLDLINEVEKVASISSGRSIVTQDSIKEVVGRYRTESVFSFLDLLGTGSLDRMLKSLNRLLDGGEEPVFLLAMLLKRVLLLLQVKSESMQGSEKRHGSSGAPDFEGQLSPFMLRILENQSKQFQYKELELLLKNLIWVDGKLKTSQINPRTLIEEGLIASSMRKKLATFAG